LDERDPVYCAGTSGTTCPDVAAAVLTKVGGFFRAGTLAARTGGDTFAAAFLECSLMDAFRLATALFPTLRAVAVTTFRPPGAGLPIGIEDLVAACDG
jgi:GGDEF domain-containing protein